MDGLEQIVSLSKPGSSPPSAQRPCPESTATDSDGYQEGAVSRSIPTKTEDGDGPLKLLGDDDAASRPSSSGSNVPFMSSVDADRELLARTEVQATAGSDGDNLEVVVTTFHKRSVPIEDPGQGFTFRRPTMRQPAGTAAARCQAPKTSKSIDGHVSLDLNETVDDSGYTSGGDATDQRDRTVHECGASSIACVAKDVTRVTSDVFTELKAAPSAHLSPVLDHDKSTSAEQMPKTTATPMKALPAKVTSAAPSMSRLSLANVTFLKKKVKSGARSKKRKSRMPILGDVDDPINLLGDAMQPALTTLTLAQDKSVLPASKKSGVIEGFSGTRSRQISASDTISASVDPVHDTASIGGPAFPSLPSPTPDTGLEEAHPARKVPQECMVREFNAGPSSGVLCRPLEPLANSHRTDSHGKGVDSLHDFHSSPPVISAPASQEAVLLSPSAKLRSNRSTETVSPGSGPASSHTPRDIDQQTQVGQMLQSVSERLGSVRVSKKAYRGIAGVQPSLGCSDIAEIIQGLIDKATQHIVEEAARQSEMQKVELRKLSEANEAAKVSFETSERERSALQAKLETFSGKAVRLRKFMNGLGNDMKKLGGMRTQINAVIAENKTFRDVERCQKTVQQQLDGFRSESLLVTKALSLEKEQMLQRLSNLAGKLSEEKDRAAILQRQLDKPREEYSKLQELLETLSGKTDEKLLALGELLRQDQQQGSGLREVVEKYSTDVQGITFQFQTASERLIEVKSLVEALSPAMQKHFEDSRRTADSLPNPVFEIETRVVDLLQAMKSDIKAQEDLVSKKASLEGEIAMLEERLQFSNAGIAELHQKAADHESQQVSLRQRITGLEATNASLLLQQGSAAELHENRLRESMAANLALGEELEKLRREQSSASATSESMIHDLEQIRLERGALQQSLAEAQAQLENLRDKPDFEVERRQLVLDHKRELETTEERVRKQAEGIRMNAAGQVSRAVKQTDLVERKLVDTSIELEQLRSEVQALQNKILLHNEGSESHQRATVAAEAIKRAAELTMNKQNSEILKLREEVRTLKESLQEVQRSKTELEDAVAGQAEQSTAPKERRKVDRRNDLLRQPIVQIPESEHEVPETQIEEESMLDDGVSELQPSQESGHNEHAIRSQILDQDGIRLANSQSQLLTEDTQSQYQQQPQYLDNSADNNALRGQGSNSLDTQSQFGLTGDSGHPTSPLSNRSDELRNVSPSILPDSYQSQDVSWSQDGPQTDMRGTQGGDISPAPPLTRRATFAQGKKRDPVASTPTTPASRTKGPKTMHSGKTRKGRATEDDADVYDGPSSPAQTNKRKASSHFTAADLQSSKRTRTAQPRISSKSLSSAHHKSPNVRSSSGAGTGSSKKRRSGKSSMMDDRFSQN